MPHFVIWNTNGSLQELEVTENVQIYISVLWISNIMPNCSKCKRSTKGHPHPCGQSCIMLSIDSVKSDEEMRVVWPLAVHNMHYWQCNQIRFSYLFHWMLLNTYNSFLYHVSAPSFLNAKHSACIIYLQRKHSYLRLEVTRCQQECVALTRCLVDLLGLGGSIIKIITH